MTLKVGRNEVEEIQLTKNRALPLGDNLKRIVIREAGIFVFVEVFDLGLVLQWDRGTRIYVKADPKWRNKVKGLCGNMNNDEQDDLNSPSGGISEVSSVLFADSWRMHPYCPDSSSIGVKNLNQEIFKYFSRILVSIILIDEVGPCPSAGFSNPRCFLLVIRKSL